MQNNVCKHVLRLLLNLGVEEESILSKFRFSSANCGVGANMLDTEIDDTTPAGPSQSPENLDNSEEIAPECLADLRHESSTKGGHEAPEFPDENSAPDQDTTRNTDVRHKSNLKLWEQVQAKMIEANDQLVDGFVSASLKKLLEGIKQLQAKGQHHKPNTLVRREDENGWSLKRLKPFFERGSNRMKKKEQNQLRVEPFRSNVSKRPKLPLMAEVREASLKEQKRRRTGEE
ncbi:hypothetical protein BSKO_03414 [Bryopsis sp. KO-2023]|nr:hypothetical protein BSKO_03414 [Bryopsis sp. KO-2023]